VKIEILPFEATHRDDCERLLHGLPDWFGIPESNRSYIEGLSTLPAFVARHRGAVAGFVSIRVHGPKSCEIEILAVDRTLHRKGIGRALVGRCEEWARDARASLLHVKTLGPSHPDPFYAETRAFYRAIGFQPLFETTAFWGADQPTLILLKPL
jgi:GNAT superfamily N-acetyltransferase